MKRFSALFLAFLLLASLVACGGTLPEEKDEKLQIVSTLFPYYDLARTIAGDAAEVTLLCSAGRESHSYEPTPHDVLRVLNADLFFYNGGTDEQWADELLAANEHGEALAGTACLSLLEEELPEGATSHEQEEEGEIEYDEHVWTSPRNMLVLAQALTDRLVRMDAEHADLFRENLAAFTRDVTALDAAFTALAAGHGYPALIFGDRFPFFYFCRAYGFSYLAAFAGCSTETEPSAATMIALIERAKAEKTPVYYLENGSGLVADAIAEAAGVPARRLDSCQSITREDMENGETYLSLMWRNYDTIRKGLTA